MQQYLPEERCKKYTNTDKTIIINKIYKNNKTPNVCFLDTRCLIYRQKNYFSIKCFCHLQALASVSSSEATAFQPNSLLA